MKTSVYTFINNRGSKHHATIVINFLFLVDLIPH